MAQARKAVNVRPIILGMFDPDVYSDWATLGPLFKENFHLKTSLYLQNNTLVGKVDLCAKLHVGSVTNFLSNVKPLYCTIVWWIFVCQILTDV